MKPTNPSLNRISPTAALLLAFATHAAAQTSTTASGADPDFMPPVTKVNPILPAKEAAELPPTSSAAPVVAEAPARGTFEALPDVVAGARPSLDEDRLYYDRPGDGNLWVRGGELQGELRTRRRELRSVPRGASAAQLSGRVRAVRDHARRPAGRVRARRARRARRRPDLVRPRRRHGAVRHVERLDGAALPVREPAGGRRRARREGQGRHGARAARARRGLRVRLRARLRPVRAGDGARRRRRQLARGDLPERWRDRDPRARGLRRRRRLPADDRPRRLELLRQLGLVRRLLPGRRVRSR